MLPCMSVCVWMRLKGGRDVWVCVLIYLTMQIQSSSRYINNSGVLGCHVVTVCLWPVYRLGSYRCLSEWECMGKHDFCADG